MWSLCDDHAALTKYPYTIIICTHVLTYLINISSGAYDHLALVKKKTGKKTLKISA
jgi:hypothetical protein